MGFHKNVEGLRTSWLFAIQIDTISSKGKRVYFYLCLRVSRKLFWGGFGFPIWWIVSKPETDVEGCLFRHLWNGWHFWHVWLFVRTVKIKLNIAKPLEVYKCLFKCCNYFVTKAMFLQLYFVRFLCVLIDLMIEGWCLCISLPRIRNYRKYMQSSVKSLCILGFRQQF